MHDFHEIDTTNPAGALNVHAKIHSLNVLGAKPYPFYTAPTVSNLLVTIPLLTISL